MRRFAKTGSDSTIERNAVNRAEPPWLMFTEAGLFTFCQ